jgi:hypothetical protein
MNMSEKVPRQRHDLIEVCLQCPMPTIQQVKLSVGQIPQIGALSM